MTETKKVQCKDDILSSVLRLNRSRIHARFKSKKHRHLVRDGLHSILLNLRGRSASPQHVQLVQRLETLDRALEVYFSQAEDIRTLESLKSLVAACCNFFNSLPSGESMKSALHHAGVDVDESQGNPHLRQIGKTASIYHLAEMLSTIASHPKFRRFCVNLSVHYVPAYRTVLLPIPAVDNASRDCRVHAEVQLVVDLDLRPTSEWSPPRVIGSSKAPCFLCEMFLNEHGRYFVPRTHGKLTPRWTIPDLNEFSQRQRCQYREIISRMNRKLQEPVSTSLRRRLDPAMSWQAFSQLNLTPVLTSYASQITSVPPRAGQLSASPGMSHTFRKEQPLPTIKLPEPSSPAISEELKQPASQTRLHTHVSVLEKPQEGSSELLPNSTLEPDKREKLGRNLLGEIGSKSASNIANCYMGQNLTEPKLQRQVQSFMNLGSERLSQASRVIRDHESWACDMLFECGINGRPKCCLSYMPHSNNMNRKIDFHDTELFLEVEYPNTAQMVIIQCSRPETPRTQPVIEIDKLEPGATLELDTGESLTGNRVMFLTKIDKNGIDQWWECHWRNADEMKKTYSTRGGSTDWVE